MLCPGRSWTDAAAADTPRASRSPSKVAQGFAGRSLLRVWVGRLKLAGAAPCAEETCGVNQQRAASAPRDADGGRTRQHRFLYSLTGVIPLKHERGRNTPRALLTAVLLPPYNRFATAVLPTGLSPPASALSSGLADAARACRSDTSTLTRSAPGHHLRFGDGYAGHRAGEEIATPSRY